MKQKYRKFWDIYWAKTPKRLKKWGDGLLWTVSIMSGITIVADYDKYISLGLLFLGLLLKFISNCFKEDDKK